MDRKLRTLRTSLRVLTQRALGSRCKTTFQQSREDHRCRHQEDLSDSGKTGCSSGRRLRGTRSCAERVLLAFGELRQTNIDLGLAGNARLVANAADPFDTPEQIVIRERINCVKSLAHWQIITESESIKEPRGRSRYQSYSQKALLHSHLFLHDQLTLADISGTDTGIELHHAGRVGDCFHAGQRQNDPHKAIPVPEKPPAKGFRLWIACPGWGIQRFPK
jgi:hypothetical protein